MLVLYQYNVMIAGQLYYKQFWSCFCSTIPIVTLVYGQTVKFKFWQWK